jgi:uncharacterized membrane protein YecN with MAPEG domain
LQLEFRIAALYAGLLLPLYLLLAMRVIASRRATNIPLGDGGDGELLRRIRVHANFSENVPLALSLMTFAESFQTNPLMLHGLGIVLVFARIIHAFGMSQASERFWIRATGTTMTFVVLIVLTVICLFDGARDAFGL